MRTKLLVSGVVFGVVGVSGAQAESLTQVLEEGKRPEDRRVKEVRSLNSYHPWQPYGDVERWEARRDELRRRLRVAAGLWPMPPETPAKPVIHSKIDRGDYTVEKVFFASYPGHYVTGNLYRPKGRSGPGPAVLSPHGHWQGGRFVDQGEKKARQQIEAGAEKSMAGARYPLQARCAQLARMGCVVFHYDMVGYADSQQIKHREGFTDVKAELWLQSFLSLQTYNSLRAFGFLASLPDVDPKRIGVTGASGGGTQTFLLCAIDPRPAACFPAVMVSTAMQGGCICENASLLRVGTGNIEYAAMAAPRPLGLTGADDWTKEIESKGGPELRRHYELLDVPGHLTIEAFLQFGHNYNQVSREVMYNFMNKHLRLGHPTPVHEQPFKPIRPEELSVFDDAHPLPDDAADAAGLRNYLSRMAREQLAALRPSDREHLGSLRSVLKPALEAITVTKLPALSEIEFEYVGPALARSGFTLYRMVLSRRGAGEQVPAVGFVPPDFQGTVIVAVFPEGKAALVEGGEPVAWVRAALSRGAAVLAPDVFLTGEYLIDGKRPEWLTVDQRFAGYTFGYNRTLLGNRVHDILTSIAFATRFALTGRIHLIGLREAGPWVVLARALAGETVGRTAAELNGFDFVHVDSTSHDMFLPGALKYGGMAAILPLCAPGELHLYGEPPFSLEWTQMAYRAAGSPDNVRHVVEPPDAETIMKWLQGTLQESRP